MNGVYLKLVCVVSMGCGKEIYFSESMNTFTLHYNTDITLGLVGWGGGGLRMCKVAETQKQD